jgi:uncharacterized membrane protein YbhN (UPF0104 family)
LKAKAVIQYVLALAVGAGIFYHVFKDVSYAELSARFAGVKWTWVAMAMCVGLFSHYLRGLRWRMLLAAAGSRVSALHTFLAVMTGYMANNAVPRMGEVVRCTALTRSDKVPLMTGAGTVVVERAVDVLTLVLMLAGIALAESERFWKLFGDFSSRFSPGPIALAGGVALVLALAVYALRRRLMKLGVVVKLREALTALVKAVADVRKLRSPTMFVVLSVGIWLGYVVMTLSVIAALPATAMHGLYFAAVLTGMGGIGMVLPAPGGGLGPFHAAVYYTFVMFGLNGDDGKALALLLHTPQLIVNTLVGIAALLYLYRAGSAKNS